MDHSTSALSAAKSYAFLYEALSPQQKLYVDARALGSVPVVAARCAGYDDPDAVARVIEHDATVRLCVESAIRLEAQNSAVTAKDVEEGLKDAVRMAANSTELRQAWRELGLLRGHYEPKKVEVGGSIEVIQKQITQMTDNELADMATIDGEFEVLDFDDEPVNAIVRSEA